MPGSLFVLTRPLLGLLNKGGVCGRIGRVLIYTQKDEGMLTKWYAIRVSENHTRSLQLSDSQSQLHDPRHRRAVFVLH